MCLVHKAGYYVLILLGVVCAHRSIKKCPIKGTCVKNITTVTLRLIDSLYPSEGDPLQCDHSGLGEDLTSLVPESMYLDKLNMFHTKNIAGEKGT